MVDRVTWVQIGVTLIVALISCNSQGSEMEIEKAQFPLLQERPAKQEGAFVGVIQIRRVTTSSGCTVPPAENTWAVFEYQGRTLPIKKVSAAEAKAIAANEALGFTTGGPLWTPQEASRVAGIKPGSNRHGRRHCAADLFRKHWPPARVEHPASVPCGSTRLQISKRSNNKTRGIDEGLCS